MSGVTWATGPADAFKPQRRIKDVKRGDRLIWQDVEILVIRVARDKSWADVRCRDLESGAVWSKRQPLPLPADTRWRAP